MADALAPAVALAQAIGRWGNWFNQELYGKPTTLPWGLKIDPAHRTSLPEKYQQYSTFHPTYLYESIWDVGVALVVLWADRRFKLGHGRAFAVYVMAYTAGRGWIEYLRIDTANHIFGVRLNVWTSVVLFVAAAVYFVVVGRRTPGRELEVEYGPRDTDGSSATGADDLSATDDGSEEPAAVADPVAVDERPGDPSDPSRIAPP
jgi:prolipoprotein diacylglyceryl transferase